MTSFSHQDRCRDALAVIVFLAATSAPTTAQCWSKGPTAPVGLTARKGYAMTYDSVRSRVVLFGGVDAGNVSYDDTWEYDGVSWAQGPGAPVNLTARSGHKMVYDTSLQRIVLFGGAQQTGSYSNDTWLYEGSAWTQGPQAPGGLVPRSKHAMAYDVNRDRVVLFGGHDGIGLYDDTWEFDGSGWSAGPAADPALTARAHHTLSYDPGRQVVVLFGGDDGVGNWRNDTWEYDGNGWYPGPSAPGALYARANHGMTYDAAIGRVVLFGGWDITNRFNDTWFYDGSGWSPGPTAPVGLYPRHGIELAYDAATGAAVVFGGDDGGAFADDTWTLGLVCCPTIVVAPPVLPAGTMGQTYSQIITASGGNAPYVFTLVSGTLPPGLTLQTSGVLSGVPSASGTFTFGVAAQDSQGCVGTITYDLTINGCAFAIAPSSLPGGALGSPYSQTLAGSGGTAPYTFSVASGALPPGIALSSGGVLSGTPTVAATFGFTVAASDALGCAASQAYALTIAGAGGSGENIIVGQGLGQPNPNRVRVYRQDGSATTLDFFAYAAGQWGVNVSGGNATGGSFGQIFTGPGPGPVYGPQVRGFQRTGAAMNVNFYAYGTLRYGVNVTTGDVDDDGYDEILTGAGPGAVFGPHVRGWSYDNSAIASISKISYFAYGTLQAGVNVGTGSVDADAFAEILTGPGPGSGFAPQVRGWNFDGATLSAIAKINFNAFAPTQYGVNVAGGDVDGDGFAEIACAPGPGFGSSFPPRFAGFDYDGNAVASLPGYSVTLPIVASYGGRVGLGDVTGDSVADLLAGAGRDPSAASTVRPYAYASGQLFALLAWTPFPGTTYGVNVASGALGY